MNGTGAQIGRAIAAATLSALLIGGCGSGDAETTAPAGDPAIGGIAPTPEAEAVAQRCRFDGAGAAPPPEEVASAFVPGLDAPEEPVHLVLEGTLVQPGGALEVAVANDSPGSVLYGLRVELSDAATGEAEPTGIELVRSIGLIAPSGEVGPCATLRVLNSTQPGRYVVSLSASAPRGHGDEGVPISAEIEVGGEPIGDPPASEGLDPEPATDTLIEAAPTSKQPLGLQEGELIAAARGIFGDRLATLPERLPDGRHIVNLMVLDGTEADAEALRDELGVRIAAVELISTPFTRADYDAQVDRVIELLQSTGADVAFGVDYDPRTGLVTLDAPEIPQAARDEIAGWDGPPVKFEPGGPVASA